MSHIGQQQPGPVKFLEYIPIVSTFTGVKRLSDTINAKRHLIDIKQNKEDKSHEYKWLCANNQSKWRAGFALVPILGNIVVMGMDIAAAWHARSIKKYPQRLKNETPEYQKEFLMENKADINNFLPHVDEKVRNDWNDDIIYNNTNIPDQIGSINFKPGLFDKSNPKVQEAYVASLSKQDSFGNFFTKLTPASKANVIKEHPDLIKDNYDVVLRELKELDRKNLNSIFEKDPNKLFYNIKTDDNPTIFNNLDIKTKIALAEKVVKPSEKFNLDMLMAIVQEDKTVIDKLQTEVVRAILDKNENYIVNLNPQKQVYFAGDKPSRLKLVNYKAALIINEQNKPLIKHLDQKIQQQLLSDKKIDSRTYIFSLNEEEKMKYLNNVKQGEFVKVLQEIYSNSSTTGTQKKELDAFVKEYLKTNRTHDKEIFDTDKGIDFFIKLYTTSGDDDKNTLFDVLKDGKQPNTNFVKILNELMPAHANKLIDDAIKSRAYKADFFNKETGLKFLNGYNKNLYQYKQQEVLTIISK